MEEKQIHGPKMKSVLSRQLIRKEVRPALIQAPRRSACTVTWQSLVWRKVEQIPSLLKTSQNFLFYLRWSLSPLMRCHCPASCMFWWGQHLSPLSLCSHNVLFSQPFWDSSPLLCWSISSLPFRAQFRWLLFQEASLVTRCHQVVLTNLPCTLYLSFIHLVHLLYLE